MPTPHRPPGRPAAHETEPFRIRRTFCDRATGAVANSIDALPERRRSLDPEGVAAFLHLGYVPGTGTLFQNVDCLPGGCQVDIEPGHWQVSSRLSVRSLAEPLGLHQLAREELLSRGSAVLQRCIARAFERAEKPIVLPISGGLDSRTLLAGLMECTDARSIHTYTYGLPGALDFEIGSLVAKAAGTRHTVLDLRRLTYTEQDLLTTARWSDSNTTLLEPMVWCEVERRFGRSCTYLPGYTGDGLGGSFYQPARRSRTEAVEFFLASERRHYTWDENAEGAPSARRLAATDTKYDGLLSHEEAIWFEHHPERYTAHHIFMNGLRYEAPFMDLEFVAFMLGVPPRYRQGKVLFDELVSSRYARLFSLPTRNQGYRLARKPLHHLGWTMTQSLKKVAFRVSPRHVVHPGTPYANFRFAMLDRPDVARLVRDHLHGLGQRKLPGIEMARIERLWHEHASGKKNHAGALVLLVSLEAAARAHC